ncbi:MAG: prepilin-type N-terminal cleavage/methylation domain-containing protein [Pseudomonadales bacterium]|nr:prepilin-type N-terminal cleavage/methylation domain-containing protein [Pseudomonadales bacterium]
MKSRQCHAQAGFTLLELMLSMSLSALLLGMLSAGVYAVVNEWQRDTSVLDETLDRNLSILQIERALTGAFPHSYVDQERLARFLYFRGTDSELKWVSTVSPQRQGGLTAWHLRSVSGEGVYLGLVPAFADDPEERFAAADTTLLLPGYEARFTYLWQESLDQKTWVDEWVGEERQSLPIAVHVLLVPEAQDRDDLMELVVPIKAWRNEDIEPVNPGNSALGGGT